jgi:rRNA maturation RNase YbeY
MINNIQFFTEGIAYRIQGKKKLRRWIIYTAAEENKSTGDICIILCDDNYLHKLNRKYLKHNTLTDIITFPLTEEESLISGDIYISLPRVIDNAKKFRQNRLDELHRVVIHGVLHLIGYNDSSAKEKAEMRVKENYYIEKLLIT